MKTILLILVAAFAVAGCSKPPEKKIIPRSEMEKMPAVEVESGGNG